MKPTAVPTQGQLLSWWTLVKYTACNANSTTLILHSSREMVMTYNSRQTGICCQVHGALHSHIARSQYNCMAKSKCQAPILIYTLLWYLYTDLAMYRHQLQVTSGWIHAEPIACWDIQDPGAVSKQIEWLSTPSVHGCQQNAWQCASPQTFQHTVTGMASPPVSILKKHTEEWSVG